MADDVATVVYAWVLDGVSTIFVTDEALDDAWAVASGFVSTHPGLKLPTGLAAAINLRKGYPDATLTTIKVDEVTDTDILAPLFGASRFDVVDLVTTLLPGATAGASLYSKHVGTEAIGSAGERRRYSCVPGFNVGLLHYGQNEAFANSTGAAPVSDDPVVWEGRRCAMYRVKLVAGAWQTLAQAKRIWWGTLRAQGTHDKGRWSFACLGPESWLGGNLAVGNYTDGIRVLPVLELVEDGFAGQAVMRGDLFVRRLDDTTRGPEAGDPHAYIEFTEVNGTDVDGYLSGVTTYAGAAAAVNSFLNDIVGSTVNGTKFSEYGNDIYFDVSDGSDGITVLWYMGDSVAEGDPYTDSDSADSERVHADLRLTMHENVWKALGYDVRQQVGGPNGRDPVENEDQYARFEPDGLGPGYWSGWFSSASPKAMLAFETGDYDGVPIQEYSSGGGTRRWPPLYPGGAVSFTGEAGQEFQLASPDDIRIAGSKSRPLMAALDDNSAAYTLGAGVGAVTNQGLMVFEGPFRRRYDANQVDPIAGYAFQVERERREGKTIQVARVCWRSVGGLVSKDTDNYGRFVVYEWLDPRLFGFGFELFDGAWGGHRNPPPGSRPIMGWPLAAWEYSDAGDLVSTVLQRIMLSTGTAGEWYEDAGLTTQLYGLGAAEAFLDLGDNDTGGTVPKDGEVPGMGLGIPASMVADPADWTAPGEAAGQHLSRCKAVVIGSASATHLVTTLLSPSGLVIGYTGGKFSLLDPWTQPTPAQAVATLTPEWYHGNLGREASSTIPTQDLRIWQAIDVLAIRGRVEPLDRDYQVEIERRASDFGMSYRSQQITQRITGDHLLDPAVPVPGASWVDDLPVRWRAGFDFWSAPHTTFTAPLAVEDGIDIWPGDGVLVTDPWMLSQAGQYGVSVAVARVLERSFNAAKEIIDIKVMLSAESEFRMYCPRAEVTRYDEQDLGPDYRLLCKDDAFGDRASGFDVDGFAEPSWSTEGGDATIEVFQFDGVSWTGGIYGVVDTVNGATSDSYITLTGALTGGTWYPDKHSVVVLRTWANQPAWPQRWYAAICEDDGTHTASTPGEKWRGI
jgi:hypothetical protein